MLIEMLRNRVSTSFVQLKCNNDNLCLTVISCMDISMAQTQVILVKKKTNVRIKIYGISTSARIMTSGSFTILQLLPFDTQQTYQAKIIFMLTHNINL